MISYFDKRFLNILIIASLSMGTFVWTFWIFHEPFALKPILLVILVRILASLIFFQDYSLSWSKATQKTFMIKSFVNMIAFIVYMPFYYTIIPVSFFLSELFLYLFAINFFMYLYYMYKNRSLVEKTKSLVIYGAGKAGMKLEEEYRNSHFKIKYFVDDDKKLQNRSIDGIKIISDDQFKNVANDKFDLLIIALPSASPAAIQNIYNKMEQYFVDIKILPTLEKILSNEPFSDQLKNISVEDLLARHPQDLDKDSISSFLKGKKVLVTGAGGSIGSEISRQCIKYGVKELFLLDHSEFNLYSICEELKFDFVKAFMHSVLDVKLLEKTISTCKPDVIIHAAAYKHVPLVEENVEEGILNNVIGTKNCIDLAIKYEVKKFILISTDKAVRPTNVMGATKRICELYAGNVETKNTEIVAVRFGNVLGSSGSVIPKFKQQIENGGPLTVTHPEITRYFMLIPEACELVLQTGAIAKGGEIFILDMGEPIKICDLAKKMIELSGKQGIEIKFTGLRPGEKLYEELLIDEADKETKYKSIMVAKETKYDIDKLNADINELISTEDKITKLKEILPEFEHKFNSIDSH
ncbi:MAG: nucleoside-diphosphate sugar epimerase/dehydratase [Sulfurospirillaceae bacterium]|nr:nucleoside-diphosphate sugar epimerase/dehydratase [Sulfurospirillaceae bacterium]